MSAARGVSKSKEQGFSRLRGDNNQLGPEAMVWLLGSMKQSFWVFHPVIHNFKGRFLPVSMLQAGSNEIPMTSLKAEWPKPENPNENI